LVGFEEGKEKRSKKKERGREIGRFRWGFGEIRRDGASRSAVLWHGALEAFHCFERGIG